MAWVSYWMICTAALHTLVSLKLYQEEYRQILGSGFFNGVRTDKQRLALWFLMSGFLMLMIGACFLSMTHIPPLTGMMLLFIALLGVCVLPRSGFWVLLPPAIAITLL